MSLDKAIEHGKEHRKPYKGSKAIAHSCRNHGSCEWCTGNRQYKFKKAELRGEVRTMGNIASYQEGFTDGFNVAKEKYERPQGEWEESHIFSCGKILLTRMDVIEHKCSHCGRWSIKWVRTIPDNFCSHCGADMRGDKE